MFDLVFKFKSRFFLGWIVTDNKLVGYYLSPLFLSKNLCVLKSLCSYYGSGVVYIQKTFPPALCPP